MHIRKFLIGTAVLVASLTANAYVVGGATKALISDSGEWAWDGSYMTGFRAALENPANFGPAGTVNQTISTVDLNVVSAATLAGVDMFVGTWISDGQGGAFSADVQSFLLAGGDVFLLQDDSGHDILGSTLGISTTVSTGSVSNGGVPLFNGPFGTATDVNQYYLMGQLDPLAIAALGGHIGGTNVEGQVTSAFWSAGEYAPGAGRLFIVADIDMIATTTACGLPLCGADYAAMNDNAIYALNTFSFLSGATPIPLPGTLLLAGTALALLGVRRRTR